MRLFQPLIPLLALFAHGATADTYLVTAQNLMPDEHITQYVMGPADKDAVYFEEDGSLTLPARFLAVQGSPFLLLSALGEGGLLGNGQDTIGDWTGQTNHLETAEFEITTDARSLRIMAMVGPELEPDNYLMGLADLSHDDEITVPLRRYDLGMNEGTNQTTYIGDDDVIFTIRKVAD